MCKDRLYFVMPTFGGNFLQEGPYSSYRLQLLFGGCLHSYGNGQWLKRVIAGFDPQTHTISHATRCVPTGLTGWDAGSSPAGHRKTTFRSMTTTTIPQGYLLNGHQLFLYLEVSFFTFLPRYSIPFHPFFTIRF